ncbi:MAG: helix-turn-helix domain-containing protein [Phycisphaera sp.]|nr:helix-turn-helix domain-containing protein [Phycisphaera sp.]
MGSQRIGIAINTQHVHAEDQELYQGVRSYSKEHPGLECALAPFAAEELKAATGSAPPFDGVLAQATPELVKLATKVGVPVVDVWRDSLVSVPINCVFPDFAAAGRMVAQHLVSRGFERFGYIVNRGLPSQAEMCDGTLIGGESNGFAGVINGQGFACSQLLAPRVVDANVRVWKRWSEMVRGWLAQQPKPIGLFVPSDWLCRYTADVAGDLGYKVPHDVGLVCAENEPNLCMLTTPSLTAIDLGYRRVGYEAAAMLHRLMNDRTSQRAREILHIEPRALHPRRSTDATSVRDPLVAGAMRYILEHAHERIGVKDVAFQAASTRRTLERRFRKVLDRSVMQEITRCRLERLKRRLSENDTPIKTLVRDSGFNNVRVLYETFVREEGLSPSAYRAKRRTGL